MWHGAAGLLLRLGFETSEKGINTLNELTSGVLDIPFFDLLFELRILWVEVILILVYVQKGGNRDAVLLDNEVLFVVVDTSDEGSKVDACLSERKSPDLSFCPHNQ